MTAAKSDTAGRATRRGPVIGSSAAPGRRDTLARMLPAATFAGALLLASIVVRLVDDEIPAPLVVLIASVPALLAARGALLVSMLVAGRADRR